MTTLRANLKRAVGGLCGVVGITGLVLVVTSAGEHGSTLVAGAQAQEASAIPREFVCSNATVSGAYGFQRHGTKIDGTLITSVGNIIFDGQGNVVGGNEWTLRNGVMTSRTIQGGTYVVSPDCTGQIVDSTQVPISQFAIVRRGRELLGMSLSAGTSVWARFEKVADTPGARAIPAPGSSR